MKRIIILTLLLNLTTLNKVCAQIDPHFSQYYAYPLWLNPALTGVMDGDIRVIGNFKSQWAHIDNGYKTAALSSDFKIDDKLALGLNLLNQTAGASGFKYLTAYGSFSYTITFANQSTIHFGLQAGLINRSFDQSKFQMGSQYDPITGYDPNTPSRESYLNSNNNIFDTGAGIFYNSNDDNAKFNPFGGLGVSHLNSSSDQLAGTAMEIKLPVRYTLHGGVNIQASENFEVTPHAIYIHQRKNSIKAIGFQTELKFTRRNSLFGGVMYRINDSAIPSIGFKIDQLIIGTSYDFNTSTFNNATNGRGGYEISVGYVFKSNKLDCGMLTPRF